MSFSTGLIQNPIVFNGTREVTSIIVSIANESLGSEAVLLEVYTAAPSGITNQTVYALRQFTLNPFNTVGAIQTYTFFADLDAFGVRIVPSNFPNTPSQIAATITLKDSLGFTVSVITQGELGDII